LYTDNGEIWHTGVDLRFVSRAIFRNSCVRDFVTKLYQKFQILMIFRPLTHISLHIKVKYGVLEQIYGTISVATNCKSCPADFHLLANLWAKYPM